MTAGTAADERGRGGVSGPRSPRPVLIGAHDLRTPYWAQFHEQVSTAGMREIVRAAPRTVRVLAAWAWRVSPRVALCTVALQVLAAAVTVSGLLATADVFTGLLAQGPTADRLARALPALLLVATLTAVRGLLQAGAGAAQAALAPRIEQRAQDELYTGLAQADLLAFDDPDFTQLVERASRHGLVAVRQGVVMVGALLSAAVTALAAVVATALLHPVLALVVVLTGLPQGWASLRAAQLQMASFARTASQERRRDVTGALLSERCNAAEVRAYGVQQVLLDEHRHITSELADEACRTGRRLNVLLTAGRAVSAGCALAGFVAIGVLVHTGVLSLAAAGTAVVAMRANSPAVTSAMLTLNRLFESGLYIRLYDDCVADVRGRRRRPSGTTPTADPDLIAMSDVSFRYPGQSRDALDGVTLELRRGEVVALVGENGSGKTTLGKLLTGLYLPTRGTVSWDGTDTSAVPPEALHDRTAVVFQDPVRWPTTAENNIRIGRLDRPDPDDDALLDAAARSGADSVFADLPEGRDTLLSRAFQDGRDVSGGQWQRLGVGRGLYRDAAVVVADEPTAALDARAEHAVFSSLRALAAGSAADRRPITVLVTHRLANIKHADRIVVLDRGRVVEQGTHEQLIASMGTYAQLFDLQAHAYRSGGQPD